MKCWECKRKILRATIVRYTDGRESKSRDVCTYCYSELKFNPCRFVEVKWIGGRSSKMTSPEIKRRYLNDHAQ